MKIESFKYSMKSGWSVNSFPACDTENTLVLVFAAPEIAQDAHALKDLAKAYPKSKIIGCSGAGEILGDYLSDNSMSVAVVCFEKTQLKIVKTKIADNNNSFEVGKCITEQLQSEDLKGIMVFSDGLNVNGSQLVQGLNTIVQEDVVITGGLAGDGPRFEKTWVIYNGEILLNHVVAVGFYGDCIQIGSASKGGWDIFGPERFITRSKDNVLYELDGKPALALYKEYLGDRAEGLPSTGLLFPLAIRQDTGDNKHLVRTILAVDEKEQSLIFAGDVPTGHLAQLMRANFDTLIDSAGETAEDAMDNKSVANDTPVLAVAISCVGRRLVLGERAEEEIESTLCSMPEGTHQLGFYSYGELCPFAAGSCDLHNQTMTMTTFWEKAS